MLGSRPLSRTTAFAPRRDSRREKPFHQERPELYVASPNHNPKLPILSISYLSRFPSRFPAFPTPVPLSPLLSRFPHCPAFPRQLSDHPLSMKLGSMTERRLWSQRLCLLLVRWFPCQRVTANASPRGRRYAESGRGYWSPASPEGRGHVRRSTNPWRRSPGRLVPARAGCARNA